MNKKQIEVQGTIAGIAAVAGVIVAVLFLAACGWWIWTDSLSFGQVAFTVLILVAIVSAATLLAAGGCTLYHYVKNRYMISMVDHIKE
jgi:TctA family transporter